MMNYQYTSSSNGNAGSSTGGVGGGGGASNNNYDSNLGGGSTNNNSQQQSLFSQFPGGGSDYAMFQSPLNNYSTLRAVSNGSNYSTPLMGNNNLDLSSAGSATGGAGNSISAMTSGTGPSSSGSASTSLPSSSSSSYSRQRFLYSKGFDLEDDLEFCPEIVPHSLNHHQHNHHGYLHNSAQQAAKFNPYTSMTFSPVSPSQDAASVVSPSAARGNGTSNHNTNVKKTPVQDRANTLSPRTHTPRIKKPLEIINPATGSKVDSPGIRN